MLVFTKKPSIKKIEPLIIIDIPKTDTEKVISTKIKKEELAMGFAKNSSSNFFNEFNLDLEQDIQITISRISSRIAVESISISTIT